MDETLICTLDDGPSAAATAAFGVWLGDCVGASPFVCSSRSAVDLIAVAAEHRARLVVTAGANEATVGKAVELTQGLDGALVVLPRPSLELWLDPPEARRRAGRAVVAGSDGSAASIEAAEIAGRIAAGLGGSALIVPTRPGIANRDIDALNALAAAEASPLIAVGAGRPAPEALAPEHSTAARMIARAARPVLIATADSKSADDELTTTDPQHAGALPAPAVDPLTRA